MHSSSEQGVLGRVDEVRERAATVRRETRGCHWREDFPDADEAFRGHLVTRLTEDGALSTDFRPIAS